MILINAENLIIGRVASVCAKKALQNEEVIIINAEKGVFTGQKKDLLKKYQTRINLHTKANPKKGPKGVRMPDQIVRGAIIGMLPRNRKTGTDAIKRVKVFIGIPEQFEKAEITDLSSFKVDETKTFIHVGELSKLLGAKW
ncbi:MAG: 50S ribosomal protein L13 [archaeon]|jgi:large subunit ribosomal protein L13|nr:50S ribosomal protein L13 [archaeon]